MSFENIPQEMRQYRQFLNWKYEHRDGSGKPTKVPYSPAGFQASVTSPATWGSFDEAVAAYQRGGFDGIGFVFTEADPFVGIDMDDCGDDQAAYERQLKIADAFGSYQEVSPSGRGLHIIVRGSVPNGRRRAKVELYPHGRFFTMTGNVHRAGPIEDRHNLIGLLHAQMGPADGREDDNFDGPEREPDTAIIERMFAAQNGSKARDLYEGRWGLHYASQSEADFALCDIIAFYSDNRAQIARMFGASQLGQREKAGRGDYVTHMLARVFDQRVPPVDTSAVIENLKAFVEAQRAASAAGLPEFDVPSDNSLPTKSVGDFDGFDVPERSWLVPGMIPGGGTVTSCGGDGGSGKSILAAQLSASTYLGRTFLGLPVARQGPVLFVTAEDDFGEVHRRMADIARAEGVTLRALSGVVVSSLADRDALLTLPGRGRGSLEPTPLYAALAARIAAMRPVLLILDPLADMFGGNEIDRSQARQHIAYLRRLAIEFDLSVVVLAHPSQSGMSSGAGTSGSTAWSNSVRSRLYLTRDPEKPNVRYLELMKSNYAAIGQKLTLEWKDGVFHSIGHAENGHAHKLAAEHVADDVFMRLLIAYRAEGKTVSRVPQSVDYAPKLFARRPEAGQLNKHAFAAAMERLFGSNRICDEMAGDYASKKKRVIGIPAADATSNMPSNSISNEFPGSSNSAENRSSNLFQHG
jgi:RecA-family ATPase